MKNVTTYSTNKTRPILVMERKFLSGKFILFLFISVFALFITQRTYALTPVCNSCEKTTAQDFTVSKMFLGFSNGTALPDDYECNLSNPDDVFLFAELTGNATRYNLYAMYTLNITTFYPDGTPSSTTPYTFSGCINTGLTDNAIPTNTPIKLQQVSNWTCGQLAELKDIYLSYQVNSGLSCGCTGGRCYYNEGFVIKAPLQVQFSDVAECVPGKGFETVTLKSNTIGGTQPYTFEWNLGSSADYVIESGALDQAQVVVTYKSAGTKTVSLKVTDSSTPTVTKTATRNDIEVVTCFSITKPAENGTFECSNTAGITNWLKTAGGATYQGGCQPVVWSYSPNPYTLTGGCSANTGSATITFIATDNCQTTITTKATLTITDTTAPTGNPQSGTTNINACYINATTPPAGTPAFDASAAAAGYTDLCGGAVTAALTNTSVSGGNCGWTVTYTFKVTDACGNSLTGQTIQHTGKDQTPPSGTPPTGTTNINACYINTTTPPTGTPEFNPTTAAAGYTDLCGGAVTAALTNTSVSGDNCGWTVTYTFKVTDACGNSLTGQTIQHKGKDKTPPSGTPPAGTININACYVDASTPPAGTPAFDASAAAAGYTDLCGGNVTAEKTNTSVTGNNCEWTVTYTFKVTDACGNSLTGQKIEHKGGDKTPPSFTKPADKTIYFAYAVAGCSYDASPAVTGNPTNLSDNCSGSLTPTYKDAVNSTDPHHIIITRTWSLQDACLNKAQDQVQIITVTRKSVVLTYTGATQGQYSDPVSLSATLKDQDNILLSGKTVKFKIGSQEVTATTTSDGIATATLTLSQPAASAQVETSFAGDCAYKPGNDADPFTILAEEACGAIDDWESTLFVNTNSKTGGSADIKLVVIVSQQDDGYAGDLDKANLAFKLTPDPNAGITPLANGKEVLSSGDYMFWATYTVTLTSSLSTSITVEWTINSTGYYSNKDCTDDQETVVTVSAPADDFITGGGYLILEKSAGSYAGSTGSKNNFGFNVKWNTNSKNLNLQGNFNTIFRINGKSYQVKSNKPTVCVVEPIPGTDPVRYKAYVVYTNAVMKELECLTCWGEGNGTIYLWIEDNGEPGFEDRIGFGVVRKNKEVFFSTQPFVSPNTAMALQQLNGGNIQVHKGSSGLLPKSAVMVNPSETGANSLRVYPNPFTTRAWFELNPSNNSHALLEIFDLRGVKITTLLDQAVEAGNAYRFEYVPESIVPEMLIYRLVIGNEVRMGKIIHQK